MGYLSPDDPVFDGVAPATGLGVNTDEASSALGSLQRHLTRRAYDTLAAVTPPAEPALVGPRANPDEADNDRGAVVLARELHAIAFLVTGMWGPDPPNNARAIAPRRRIVLPLARENPYDPRMRVPFFERMRLLDDAIMALGTRAEERYDKKGTATGPRKRPWTDALAKMLRAVRYVRSQESAAHPSVLDPHPLGLGAKGWGVLAAQGNKKLPFVAYSELPMATCPGAGACAVRLDVYETGARKGWCYSFRAWRYPDGFARQFLNTLANYADREFAILRVKGPSDPDAYAERVHAAIDGMRAGERLWPQYVKGSALKLTKKSRAKSDVFMRLFVDGDINYEDNIVAWMDAVAQMAAGSPDLGGTPGHVEVYGYSKCWQQFANVDGFLEGQWPANYALNLSSGSIYFSGKYSATRTKMESLPISRGYFEAVPLDQYIGQLEAQTRLLAEDPNAPIPMPPAREQPFRFDAERIRAFLRINAIRTVGELLTLLPDAPVPRDARGAPKALKPEQVRHLAYDAYLRRLVADPTFGAIVRRELVRDRAPQTETAALDALEQDQREKLAAALASGTKREEEFTQKALQDKALALTLHETLWSFGLGGSCPLVCGNCSDSPEDPALGVHRCASKTTFRGKTIHIGIH